MTAGARDRPSSAPLASTLDGDGALGEHRGQVAASLVAVHPPELTWAVELGIAPVELGRAARGAARLDHSTVSREHLGVAWEPSAGAHLAYDRRSRNGARVDGVRLGDRPAVLADGSVVQIGDVFAIYQRGALHPEDPSGALPGRSAAMGGVRRVVAEAARDPSPVLITGETGTGKEWIARAVHAGSGRTGPLVAVNCAALGRELLESQLFGHVRGAFTGATSEQPGLWRAADGGTVFLDELGELPLELQPKLLRALQEREVLAVGATRAVKVDVRVCAATNRDLAAAIAAGTFRRDLYARLALWEIAVPPLRARRVDLLAWLDRLYRRWFVDRGRPVAPHALAPSAVEAILLHAWTDNLRGLDRLVHALASRVGGACDGAGPITAAELPSWLTLEPPAPVAPIGAAATTRAPVPSRAELEAAYAELGGSVRGLARRFGRDRKQIHRWLDAYGLDRPRGK